MSFFVIAKQNIFNLTRGHNVELFTQVVWAPCRYIGCAAGMLKYTESDEETTDIYLSCNFELGNMEGEPIYTEGKAATKCKNGPSEAYEGLCKGDNDGINYNPYPDEDDNDDSN